MLAWLFHKARFILVGTTTLYEKAFSPQNYTCSISVSILFLTRQSMSSVEVLSEGSDGFAIFESCFSSQCFQLLDTSMSVIFNIKIISNSGLDHELKSYVWFISAFLVPTHCMSDRRKIIISAGKKMQYFSRNIAILYLTRNIPIFSLSNC